MADVDTAFVKQYGDNIMLLAQQLEGSRLRNRVYVETGVVGEEKYVEQLGPDTATKRTTRHADTPITDPDHQRRRVTMYDYEVAKLLDDQDKLKMLVDPTSSYVRNGAAALGRAMDDEIITALGGTAYSGKEGGTSVSLPSAQKVVVASSGLTVAKLRSAAKILNGAEVPKEGRTLVYTSDQLDDLLGTTEVTSSDYNNVKALVDGAVDTFLGFKFVHSERLGVDGSSDRLCYAFQMTGVALCIAQDIKARVSERADKGYATQTYLSLGLGATRLEEEKVVEIACAES